MQETAGQYTQRLFGYAAGKEPLRLQEAAPKKLAALIKGKKKQQLTRRPAPGKWSITEIMAHLADAEIAVAWRLRQILSNNGIPVQAYDQDSWAKTFDYARRDPRQSLESFRILRQMNLTLLKAAPRQLWENYGQHQERGNESISHMVRMTAGHDLNHLQQVEGILKGTR
jgi:DinB superfamily